MLTCSKSLGYFIESGIDPFEKKNGYPHPGFAWAATRDFIEKVGGLID